MGFLTRSLSLQRWFVLFALVAAGVAFSTNTLNTFQVPKSALVLLAAGVVLMLGVARTFVTGRVRVPCPTLLGVAVLFLLAALVATLLADSPAMAAAGEHDRQSGLASYAAYVVLLAGTAVAFDVDRVQRIAVALLGAAGVAALYGLLQLADLDPLNFRGEYAGQVFATLGNPNWAGAYTGLGVPVAAWMALSRRWPAWTRWGAGGLGVLLLGVSVATRSLQGPLVAAVGLGVVAVAWSLDRDGIWRDRIAPGIVAIGGIGAVLVGLGIFSLGPLSGIGREVSVELRRLYWETAWRMFSDQPLTGVGFDLYGSYFLAYRPESTAVYDARLAVTAPHSVPLGMFASGGLVLGLLYLAFVGVTGWLLLRGLLRHRGERLLLLGAFGGVWLGYQAQSLISIDVPALAVTHWIGAGAIAVVAAGGADPAVIALPWGERRASSRQHLAWLLAGAGTLVILIFPWRAWTADVAARDAEQLRLSGDFAAAIERGDTAVGRAPWHPEYWYALGKALDAAGQRDAALAVYDRSLELDPRALDPYLGAARIHEEQGDPDAAWRAFETAIELSDRNPIVLAQAGQFLLRQRRFEEALEVVDRALERDPQDARIHLFRGQALVELGREHEARSALERALELATDTNPQPGDEQVAEVARSALDALGVGGSA